MISKKLLKSQYQEERKMFEENHKKSGELFQKAQANLLGGVPMNWMVRWAGSWPVFVEKAKGAHFTDVDGNEYMDFCLGDTGSMLGHAMDPVIESVSKAIAKGTTLMLPTEDAIFNGQELTKRFGMKYWQFTTSATDANRFALRLAREITGRNKILAYNWCYHGSVDETVATLDEAGNVIPKPGNVGPQVSPALTSKIIEWNDIDALENALKDRDVAAVLAEPALTNIGIVHPDPGYHEALRKLTKKYGTYLIIDETHTICAGTGGCTKAWGLEPDMVTMGKTIAAGIPTGAYGMSEEVGKKALEAIPEHYADVGGVGGTLAGNALAMAAMRTTLSEILTEKFYEKNIPLAERFCEGVKSIISKYHLPWNATVLGNRTEYWFRETPAHNGLEAEQAQDELLDKYMHLASMNRGVLMTPFHNMALVSADITEKDIDYHTTMFDEIVKAIIE